LHSEFRQCLDSECEIMDLLVTARAGLTIVAVVPWEGAPAVRHPLINCQIFTTLFRRLNI